MIDVGGERQNVVGAADRGSLKHVRAQADTAGRGVKLEGVPVESVIGDRVFWVGKDASERTLVVLDPRDRRAGIPNSHQAWHAGHPGGHGGAHPLQGGRPRLWQMVSSKEADALPGHPVFIHATQVTIDRSSSDLAREMLNPSV